jgi:hypothetical protein
MQIGDLIKLMPQWTASCEPLLGIILNNEHPVYSGMILVQWLNPDDQVMWLDGGKVEVLCR